MRLFKIVIFRLKLGFLSIYPPIIFSKSLRNLDVIWSKALYPSFNVISELYSVLLKEVAEVRKKALPFVPARYIRSLRRYTAQQIGF